MSARGTVPNLAEAIAGERIRGSWWGHPRSHQIYRLATAVCASRDVLVCKLIDGRVTLVHRRLWPALARLSNRIPKSRLAAVHEEHTSRGHHRVRTIPFSRWMPGSVLKQSEQLTVETAIAALGEDLFGQLTRTRSARGGSRPRRG